MASSRGRRGSQNESKLGTTVRAIVFFALIAGVVFATKPLWSSPERHSAAPSTSSSPTATPTKPKPVLSVRYRPGTGASGSQPKLQIVNVSKQDIDLSTVTLRYYFKQEGSQAYATNCVYAAIGCSKVTGRIAAPATAVTGADHYLQVSFASGAGALKPNANSGDVDLQLYVPGGAAIHQSADYSFDGTQTTAYHPNTRIAAFVGKTLAFGQEPSGTSAQPPGTAAPAVPAGVYFDDFHYSGSGDPALNKHDWVVRTASGGPGIKNTWKSSGISFPTFAGADGGQVLNLTATTDGSRSGTTQAEIHTTHVPFFTGTYAARMHFTDAPTSGDNGDPINEDFYMISPRDSDYSELDAEYEPNGGWGAPGPRLDTTTWYSVYNCGNVNTSTSVTGCDRSTKKNMISLDGWHTVVITAADDVVTYSVDDKVLYTTSGKYYPRESMSANFNAWFVDLDQPISGKRTWDMQVNWLYYNSAQTMSLSQVHDAVSGFYANGENFINTVDRQ